MFKRRIDSFQNESNKKIKTIRFSHEFLSQADVNDVFIFQKSNIMIKDESNKNIKQRLRLSILKKIRREKRRKQIENEIKEKKKTKKQYSQKLKTVRDRARMIKYFNEKKIIARVKNVDRVA